MKFYTKFLSAERENKIKYKYINGSNEGGYFREFPNTCLVCRNTVTQHGEA